MLKLVIIEEKGLYLGISGKKTSYLQENFYYQIYF